MYTTFETTLRNGRAACRSQSGAAGSSGNCRRVLSGGKRSKYQRARGVYFHALSLFKIANALA